MTLHGLSNAFLAAVATDHKAIQKIEVHEASGTLLSDITQSVLGGSVGVDETREIRRTCQLTLAATQTLIPADLADLLHPASGNELWLYRGVEYPGGATEFAQLGVFRMTKPVITDTQGTLAFTVNGQDRASVVARLAWQVPYQVPSGYNAGGAIQQALTKLIGNIYPGLTFNFVDDLFSYPATTWGATPGSPSDPMSDFITFGANAGCELFFDVTGTPTYRFIVNPLTAVVVDDLSFVDGTNCTMDMASRTLDETTAYNGVTLYCNGTGIAQPFTVKRCGMPTR